MLEVKAVMGDITQIKADALVTLVNSSGMWFGGIDGAIGRVAGSRYHLQLGRVLDSTGLTDGQVVTTQAMEGEHSGGFDDVVFVIDDLQSPLSALVFAALEEARRNQYHHVTMPMMRSGVMRGVVEKDDTEVIAQMQAGFRQFSQTHPDTILTVTIVVYSDVSAFESLRKALRQP